MEADVSLMNTLNFRYPTFESTWQGLNCIRTTIEDAGLSDKITVPVGVISLTEVHYWSEYKVNWSVNKVISWQLPKAHAFQFV